MNAIVPLSVRLPAGVTCSVTAPVTSVAATTADRLGAGDGDVDLPADQPRRSASSSVMVKVSTLVWPAARYSTAESATV